MKKKIVFFIPNVDDGGIEKNLILLSNFFFLENFDIEILYTRISSKVKSRINKNIKLIKSKKYININFLSERINNSINCFIYSIFNLEVKKKTIIFSLQDHPFAITLSKIKNTPVIVRIANHPISSLKYFNNFFKYKLKLFIKIFFYNFSTFIICNSKESADFFKTKLNIKRKVSYIYNPIEIRKLNKKKFKRKKFEIVTIGRLEKQKNVIGTLDAISIVSKNFKKIKLSIVGKGSEKETIIKYASKINIKKNIDFHDFCNPRIFYQKKGLFILNSFFEGLPNVLIEALSFKIPIISSRCRSGPKEILNNGKFGYLVNVDDPEDLAKKIEYVLKNYDKALSKSKLGFKSLNRFSYKKQANKYLGIINKIY